MYLCNQHWGGRDKQIPGTHWLARLAGSVSLCVLPYVHMEAHRHCLPCLFFALLENFFDYDVTSKDLGSIPSTYNVAQYYL